MTRKLKERLGLVNSEPRSNPDVELRIPDSDGGREMVAEMAAGFAAAQAMLVERNQLRNDNETLRRALNFARNSYATIEREKDYWRAQAVNYTRANGELAATVANLMKTIEGVASNMNSTIMCVQAINDELSRPISMPVESQDLVSGPSSGDQSANFDSELPPVNAEELRELAARLAANGYAAQ